MEWYLLQIAGYLLLKITAADSQIGNRLANLFTDSLIPGHYKTESFSHLHICTLSHFIIPFAPLPLHGK